MPAHKGNRIVKARRYAKHVERQLVRREIAAQLQEEIDQYIEDMEMLEEYFPEIFDNKYKSQDWNY